MASRFHRVQWLLRKIVARARACHLSTALARIFPCPHASKRFLGYWRFAAPKRAPVRRTSFRIAVAFLPDQSSPAAHCIHALASIMPNGGIAAGCRRTGKAPGSSGPHSRAARVAGSFPSAPRQDAAVSYVRPGRSAPYARSRTPKADTVRTPAKWQMTFFFAPSSCTS